MPRPKQTDADFLAELQDRFPIDQSYVVAVSGGMDSVTLLHILTEAGYKNLHVAHFNHLLRGRESDQDELFVKNLAAVYELPCSTGRSDVASYATERKLSIETAARELRYEWLASLARQMPRPAVFLGHHADDQVETVLINLFRGAGSRGISGMDEVSTRVFGDLELLLLRPLLGLRREDLKAYAKANSLSFREDSSNAENDVLRNRIRNLLLPQINEVFERDTTDAILRAARIASEDEFFLQSEVSGLSLERDGKLSVPKLRLLPAALRKRYLANWLRESEVPNISEAVIARVEEVLHSDAKPAKTNLPGGGHVRRKNGTLFISDNGQEAPMP